MRQGPEIKDAQPAAPSAPATFPPLPARETTADARSAIVPPPEVPPAPVAVATTVGGFRGAFEFCRNFYPAKVEYLGLTFRCSEGAYMAAKFTDPAFQQRFCGLTGNEAKQLGKTKHPSYRKDWEAVKVSVMREVLASKFSDPKLQETLLATVGTELVEVNWWGDRFWGVCKGEGQNHLGRLLMELRDQFLSNQLQQPAPRAALAPTPQFRLVAHVGDLSQPRNPQGRSFEGSGLSVSQHPEAWTKIARLGGRETWLLHKANPSFYEVPWPVPPEIYAWCEAKGFIEPALRFRAEWEDSELEGLVFCDFDTLEEAQEEAEDLEAEIKEVQGWKLGPAGIAYCKAAFGVDSRIIHNEARDFAPMFWAESQGYDGCWWHETLDPINLSAPRGVIFQSKLDGWSKQVGEWDDECLEPSPDKLDDAT